MFATQTKIAATTMVLALTCSGICLADLPNKDAGSLAGETIAMFPDGLAYDFGKVQRGPLLWHTFRIVNTTGVSLEITRVYWG
jgi:hypothetical protein